MLPMTTPSEMILGTVITSDLPLMAQKRPGDTVRFQCVTVQQGQMARRDSIRKLKNLQEDLERGNCW